MNQSASDSLMRNQYLAKERLSVGRDKISDKEYKIAYDILKDHRLNEGADYAEIEWHLGWIALSFTNQTDVALSHFLKMIWELSLVIAIILTAFYRHAVVFAPDAAFEEFPRTPSD